MSQPTVEDPEAAPSRRTWALAPVALLGALAGIIGWGGLNTAMEATNSLEFCISCHEMRDNVFAEYRNTVHYLNASGVRAVCADCHVPRDWSHKVARKVQATGEIVHWLRGTIDTREKFEARRHELAAHEWERMRAGDSRECRNCHSFAAMDFHRQSPKASTAMQAAMKSGQTCIDCHKGIAHTLPDIDARHRAASAALAEAAAARTPTAGETAHALRTLVIHWPDGDGEAGTLAPGAPVRVGAPVDGDVLVEIDGWRRDGRPELIYRQLGKRILVATLGENAVEAAREVETREDPDSGRSWTRVRLAGRVAARGLTPDLSALWAVAARINADACSFCHAVRAPERAKADAWIGHIAAMKRYTALTADEAGLLLAYLQSHAADVDR